jgi:wyosine [tRNA(Phe)-imidazoG37] synthetase (radical SAM superfamily)
MNKKSTPINPFADHPRLWRNCRYVYPVVSRRAEGLSIGVNLNHDQFCNFGCLYCQVDRSGACSRESIDIKLFTEELTLALDEANSGRIWQEPRFANVAQALRRVNDIAFSGDGEPTICPDFAQAVSAAALVRERMGPPSVKLVLITNATLLHQPRVQRALAIMDRNNGEIWAKLDCGTDDFFRRVNNPIGGVTLKRVLDNILESARQREIVIQTLLFKIDGQLPPQSEIDAYCRNIGKLLQGGAQIRTIQIHTVARRTASPSAGAIDDGDLAAISEQVKAAAPTVQVKVYGSGK